MRGEGTQLESGAKKSRDLVDLDAEVSSYSCYGGLRVNLGDTRAFLVGFWSFKVLLDGNQCVSGAGTTGISRYRRQWSL